MARITQSRKFPAAYGPFTELWWDVSGEDRDLGHDL
jgi:hypothetical protein